MDDEVRLDEAREAFAVLLPALVLGLLTYLVQRTRATELAADLCAEAPAGLPEIRDQVRRDRLT